MKESRLNIQFREQKAASGGDLQSLKSDFIKSACSDAFFQKQQSNGKFLLGVAVEQLSFGDFADRVASFKLRNFRRLTQKKRRKLFRAPSFQLT